MAELLVLLLAVVAIGIAAYVVLARARRATSPPRADVSLPATGAELAEVTLPIDDADPNSPAARRLVADAAHRAFAGNAAITTVVVLSRTGRELGRVERRAQVTPRPFVDAPLALREHAPRHHDPHVPVETEGASGAQARMRFAEEPAQRHRTLADHFELPDRVRTRIGNAEDAVEVIRAILDEAGVRSTVDGNLIHHDDRVLVVLRTPIHAAVEPEHLNAAFLHFQRIGAKRGVVVTAGSIPSHEVRRREALAPTLLHAGPDGIQRMADALALGANPLDFLVHNW